MAGGGAGASARPDSLARRTLWSAAGTLAAAIGRLVAAIAVARLLGPELTGRYAFLVWCVEFGVLLSTLGLPTAVTRYVAELAGRGESGRRLPLLRWAVRRYLLLILCAMITIHQVASHYLAVEPGIAPLLAALLSLQALSALVSAQLAGDQEFPPLARLGISSGLTLMVVQPLLAFEYGLYGALIGFALSAAVALLRLPPLLRIALDRGAEEPPPGMVHYALYGWLAALVSAVVWARAELFFLDRYGATGEAGYFSVGLTLSQLATLGATLLTGALLPHFSSLAGGADRAAIQRDYGRFTIVVALYAVPVGLVGAALIPELVPLLLGSAYRPAIDAAAVLMLTGLLAGASVGSTLLHGFGRSPFIFRSGLVGALLLGGGCLLVVPEHGALGAAWLRLGVQALLVAAGTLYIQRILGMAPPYAAVGRVLLAGCMAALAAHLALRFAPFWPLLWGAAAGGGGYLLALRGLRPVPMEEADALIGVAGGLPGPLRGATLPLMRWIFGR